MKWLTVLLLIPLTSYFYPDKLYIVQLPEIVVTAKTPIPNHLKEDWLLLARLVDAEAENQPFEGQRAVADVVLNTAAAKKWSVARTITDPGRFDGVKSKRFHREPTDSCKEAARLAIMGYRILPANVLYFHNPITSTDSKWVQFISQYPYKLIGNHLFCYKPKSYRA